MLKKMRYCGISVESGNTCCIFALRYFREVFFNPQNLKTNFPQKKQKNPANAQFRCFEGPFKRLKIPKNCKFPPNFRYFLLFCILIFSKAAVFCTTVEKATCSSTEILKYRTQYRKFPPLHKNIGTFYKCTNIFVVHLTNVPHCIVLVHFM